MHCGKAGKCVGNAQTLSPAIYHCAPKALALTYHPLHVLALILTSMYMHIHSFACCVPCAVCVTQACQCSLHAMACMSEPASASRSKMASSSSPTPSTSHAKRMCRLVFRRFTPSSLPQAPTCFYAIYTCATSVLSKTCIATKLRFLQAAIAL